MILDINYEQLSVLVKILTNNNVDLTGEECLVYNELTQDLVNKKDSIDNEKLRVDKAIEDFEVQKETNNYKYLCTYAKLGTLPRCAELHKNKYCMGISSCYKRYTNPEYKS